VNTNWRTAQKGFAEGDLLCIHMNRMSSVRPAARQPRFQALLQKMNLCHEFFRRTQRRNVFRMPTNRRNAVGRRSCFAIHPAAELLGTTLIFALLLWKLGVRGKAPTESNARPLQFTPGSGPIEGDRLVFIDVDEPAAAIGSASMACRFGRHAASPGDYDATSGRYVCRTPAHSRPESVILTITLNGAEFPMPERYVYTTRANSASPVIGIDVPTIQQQVKRVRELIPRGVAFAAVLKNGEPVGLLADAMARATQVDYFCVPNLQDGIALREAGVKAPIMVLFLTEPSYAPVLLHYGLEPAAYSLAWVDEANRLLQRARGTLQVHLWIDTGLGREGVMPAEALALARAVNQSPKLRLQGIATHFCCNERRTGQSGGRPKNHTALQKSRFDETSRPSAPRASGSMPSSTLAQATCSTTVRRPSITTCSGLATCFSRTLHQNTGTTRGGPGSCRSRRCLRDGASITTAMRRWRWTPRLVWWHTFPMTR
jgi:hypothetical protein